MVLLATSAMASNQRAGAGREKIELEDIEFKNDMATPLCLGKPLGRNAANVLTQRQNLTLKLRRSQVGLHAAGDCTAHG